MLNILLIEDDLDLAKTVVQYLALENIQCDHASNGVAGLQLAQENQYEALLLDLNLPRLDGLSVCSQLRSGGNDTPILMLTARDQLSDKLDGFHVGTDDYVIKPFELPELVVRIKALARRRSGQSKILRYGCIEMKLDERKVYRKNQKLKLSPIGWKLLETLLRAAPAVVTRQQLESSVWKDTPPDSNSLKVHIHHLRKAVDAPFSEPLIHTVPGHGFSLHHEDDDE